MYTSVAFKKKISLLALFLVPKQLLQSFSPTTVEVPPPPFARPFIVDPLSNSFSKDPPCF